MVSWRSSRNSAPDCRPAVRVAHRDHRAPGCRSRSAAGPSSALGNMQPSQQMCWNALRELARRRRAASSRRRARCRACRWDRSAGNGGRSCRASPSRSRWRRSARRGNRSSRAAARAVSFLQAASKTGLSLPVVILRAGCAPRGRCSPACRAACAPCRPGSPSVFGPVDHFQQLDHAASSHACRPSRFRPRRRAVRRCSRPRRRLRGRSAAISLVLPTGSLAHSSDSGRRIDAHDAIAAGCPVRAASWRCGRPS